MPSKTKTVKPPRARIELYKAPDGWRFRAKAGNGRTNGASEQGIKQRAYQAKRAHKQFPDLPVFVVDDDGTLTPYSF